MQDNDPQLRHFDRAWASTVRAFQGRTVDKAIAVIEASHPHLTTQKSFYVEMSRARHRAELVTNDRTALGAHLEAATGERVAVLEALEPVAARAETVSEVTAEDAGKATPEPVVGEVQKAQEPTEMGFDLGL